MNQKISNWKGLTGNQLKIIALIAMTCDHVGRQLFPEYPFLQIIGRLAFPIFAYMIAEGCQYTRNRKKYLLTMAALAFICQVVYYIAMGSLYQCVLVTFSLSIGLTYALDNAVKQRTTGKWILSGVVFISIVFVSVFLPRILSSENFEIDYGLWGILLPVAVYFGKTKIQKLLFAAIFLILVGYSLGGIQWYSMTALLLLIMYSGKRGKWKLKDLFYIYYPLHLVGIYVISIVLDRQI